MKLSEVKPGYDLVIVPSMMDAVLLGAQSARIGADGSATITYTDGTTESGDVSDYEGADLSLLLVLDIVQSQRKERP